MRITYVLPAYFNMPIGGYNVHYTYAGLLRRAGHAVTIVFPRRPMPGGLAAALRGLGWGVRTRLRNRPLIGTFPLDPGVRVRLVPDLSARWLKRADVLVATGWETAEALAAAPADRGAKAYVVFDYEYYMTAAPDIPGADGGDLAAGHGDGRDLHRGRRDDPRGGRRTAGDDPQRHRPGAVRAGRAAGGAGAADARLPPAPRAVQGRGRRHRRGADPARGIRRPAVRHGVRQP